VQPDAKSEPFAGAILRPSARQGTNRASGLRRPLAVPRPQEALLWRRKSCQEPSRERFSDRSRLVPAIGIFGETRALEPEFHKFFADFGENCVFHLVGRGRAKVLALRGGAEDAR
jgi:hypothetical protein